MIDVVVADSQPLYLDALARVVRQDSGMHLAAEAQDGRAALAAIRLHVPAVAIVARELAELDGDSLLIAVMRGRLSTRVLLIDSAPGPRTCDLLGEGAAGVLSRRVSSDALRRAVHAVARGGTALCDEAQAALAGEIRARHPRGRPLLSPREQEVLELVAEGLSAPAIAGQLQVGTATVRTHLQHLYDKLEVNDRGQLVYHAMRRKLIV